jgi:hypothetical protein
MWKAIRVASTPCAGIFVLCIKREKNIYSADIRRAEQIKTPIQCFIVSIKEGIYDFKMSVPGQLTSTAQLNVNIEINRPRSWFEKWFFMYEENVDVDESMTIS